MSRDTMWRSGWGGTLGRLRQRNDPHWDAATLDVHDAAHVFEEVLGDRRRREAEAEQQERKAQRSRFL